MPTETGGDTISERLVKRRTELVRVEATIARMENNGASFAVGGGAGTAVTEIAYERATSRKTKLDREILDLERRLGGGAGSPGFAVTKTRMES